MNYEPLIDTIKRAKCVQFEICIPKKRVSGLFVVMLDTGEMSAGVDFEATEADFDEILFTILTDVGVRRKSDLLMYHTLGNPLPCSSYAPNYGSFSSDPVHRSQCLAMIQKYLLTQVG
jgi:hypothetical protein